MESKIKIIKKGDKITNFLKKYGYFIVAGLIVLGITLTVILTTVKHPSIDENLDPIDTSTDVLTFVLPLAECSIGADFSLDELIYNENLGWFETHSGVALVSSTSTDVLAACAGTVTDVSYDSLTGTMVKIKHSDSFSTVYGSLGENITVKVGDKVTAGQKIGVISVSDNSFLAEANLFFQVIKDGIEVDPSDYLELGNK